METLDYETQFQKIKQDVVKTFTKALDIQASGNNRAIKVNKVWIDDSKSPSDWESQREAIRKDKTWGVPVYASLDLIDRKTGKVFSSAKRIKVATLPKNTDLGSFIVEGKHYQVQNQLRRKPGIYVTERKSGQKKTEINIAGRPFDIEYDDEKAQFNLIRGQSTSGIPLYPILSRLGITDAAMAKAWGEDVLAASKAVSAKKQSQSVIKAAEYFTRSKFTSADDAAKAISEFLFETELKPEVTKETVGKAYKRATPDAILRGSVELLKAARGERKPDDRQALEFKKVMGMRDLVKERLVQPNGELAASLSRFRQKIFWRLGNKKSPPTDINRMISSNELSPLFNNFFSSSELAHTTDQTNPLNIINGMSKITILGEGGVMTEQAIRDEERGVHPSHLGFVDPIHTPDSSKIGTVNNLPIGVRRSGDDLQTRIIDPRTKKTRYATPAEMKEMTVAFPDQYAKGDFVDKKVKALVKGELRMVDAGKVDAVLASPKQAFSVSSNTIPFLPSVQGVRGQMATKMLEQAIPLSGREAPLVQVKAGQSTMENAIGEGFSIRALEDGVVESVTPNRIVIKTVDGKVEQPIYNNLKLNKKAFLHADPVVEVGQEVAAGDVIADSNFTKDGTLAIGTNLRAAYIPYKGLNFEDGIVITESAAEKLTSEHIHEHAVSPDKGDEYDLESFMAWSPTSLDLRQSDMLDKAGVIRKGQILKKGDPIWVGTRENKYDPEYIAMKKLAPNRSPRRGHMEKWLSDVDGEVVDVIKTGKKLKVYVKTRERATIGDKLTNRHGGKGIITKIIADGEAPHTEDMEPIDILLNPHGIVSRINPSQMLETAAAKMAKKVGVPYIVDNFSGEDYLKKIQNDLAKTKTSDKEKLFDPHSKEALGDVLIGPQYFLKLNKQATSQFSARSDGKYDANRSPLRGGADGAKSLDLLTFYSMLAHGSRANLREMSTYKASQNPQFWNWLSGGNGSGLVKPPPEPTFAYRKFEAYLKGAGVNMQRRGSKMVLGPLTDKHVEKMSNGEITEPIFVRGKDLREEKGGLMDINITGGKGGDKWAHMALAEPTVNSVFEKPILALTGLEKAQYKGLIAGKLFVDAKSGEFADEGLTGGAAIKKRLSLVDIDKEIKASTDDAKKAKSTTGLDKANKKLKYLHALKKLDIRPEDAYVQTKMPILPPQFRPIIEMEDGQISNPGINTLYRDVGLVSNELKWQNTVDYIPDDVKAELRDDLHKSVAAVAGLGDPVFRYRKPRIPTGLIKQIAGKKSPKEGFFISKVLKRNQDLVGRGTIIPDPKLGLDEIGLPEEMSWNLFEPFITRRLVNYAGKRPIDASNEVRERTPGARAALEAEMAERPILLNRAPSLHKFSIMAFKPRLTDGKAIKIPPLVVKGFNADFDGDAMTVHVPILPDAVAEADRMLPSNNLFSPGTGQIMIQPQNESALGLYQLSKDPEGAKKVIALLPKKLQEKYTGTVLNKKNLGKLMRDLAEESPREHGKVIDKLKMMGDDHTYKTGFTVGIDDLVPSIPEREGIFARTQKAISKLDLDKPEEAEKARVIMDDANKELETALDVALGKQGNNFHTMVSSGARGNMTQLKQIMSSPFMVPDHKGAPIPIPVTRSFAQGLKFSDYWNTLYGARTVATEKQLQTSKPGAFNKDIMATVVTNVISDTDCETKKGVFLPLTSSDLNDRYIAKGVSVNGTVIAKAGTLVSTGLLNTLRERKVEKLEVRSPLTCSKPKGTCAKCYGLNEDGQSASIGDNVGALSGQALSEPLTQMTLRTFHSGGVSKARGVATGYDKIDKLLKMQKIKRGKATLSLESGKVESVRAAAGGTGKNVKIGKKTHFVPNELWDSGRVRVGMEKKKGDILSFGIAQPDELAQLKGMLPAQEYIVDEIQGAYKKEGVNLKRRAIETVIRSVGNTTRILDPGDSQFLHGDIAPWTVVDEYNNRKIGKKSLDEAIDHRILEDLPGVKSGTILTPRMKRALELAGISEVEVGNKPIIDAPFLKGIKRIPMLRDDWMSQMGYQQLEGAIVGGAARLAESDIHGYAPVPAFAFGAEFGDAPGGKSKEEGVY